MFIGLLFVGLVSCGSDDDEGGSIDQNLVGTWYKVSYDYTAAWKFEKNGTCQYTEWGKRGSENWDNVDTGTWNVNDNKLTILFTYDDGDYDKDTYVYSISDDGKTLTLSEGDYGQSGTYTKK